MNNIQQQQKNHVINDDLVLFYLVFFIIICCFFFRDVLALFQMKQWDHINEWSYLLLSLIGLEDMIYISFRLVKSNSMIIKFNDENVKVAL